MQHNGYKETEDGYKETEEVLDGTALSLYLFYGWKLAMDTLMRVKTAQCHVSAKGTCRDWPSREFGNTRDHPKKGPRRVLPV